MYQYFKKREIPIAVQLTGVFIIDRQDTINGEKGEGEFY